MRVSRQVRMLPMIVHSGRLLLPDVDLGFAMTDSVLGPALAVLTVVLGVCWRLTTPVHAPPVPGSAPPIDMR